MPDRDPAVPQVVRVVVRHLRVPARPREAANWLDAISNREHVVGDHPRIRALLYARKRLHHQWSAGMHFDQARQTWVWYPTANILLPDDEHYRDARGERAYERHLAAQPVLEAFTHALGYLERRWPEDG